MPGNRLSDDAGSKLRGAEVISQQFNRNFVSTVFTIHLQIYLFVGFFYSLCLHPGCHRLLSVCILKVCLHSVPVWKDLQGILTYWKTVKDRAWWIYQNNDLWCGLLKKKNNNFAGPSSFSLIMMFYLFIYLLICHITLLLPCLWVFVSSQFFFLPTYKDNVLA